MDTNDIHSSFGGCEWENKPSLGVIAEVITNILQYTSMRKKQKTPRTKHNMFFVQGVLHLVTWDKITPGLVTRVRSHSKMVWSAYAGLTITWVDHLSVE